MCLFRYKTRKRVGCLSLCELPAWRRDVLNGRPYSDSSIMKIASLSSSSPLFLTPAFVWEVVKIASPVFFSFLVVLLHCLGRL